MSKKNHITLYYKKGTAIFNLIRLNHLHPIMSENKKNYETDNPMPIFPFFRLFQ
jgi:hypothetical protein